PPLDECKTADLAIHVHGKRAGVKAAERAEIDHPARRRPRKRMGTAVGGGALADHLAAGVDRISAALAPAERAAINHPARRRPRERMGRVDASDGAATDHVAAAADRDEASAALHATAGCDVHDPPRRRPRTRAAAVTAGD